ncbi:MAG: phosphatase PAP2 family protein [Roseiflexus sp.]|nr:phosphatase PAP2 family protein [Roseiflexus sp.]MCS7287806.1 phosphatase PAP2 family protein [Roseiflexus sp.]MDW8145680.1 phosphatase PAP2 family protein [Roseiflexaceae bacterium]MDW8232120.1 phosphatase PAP2 family protein [Roseiflexaceae bacterium]
MRQQPELSGETLDSDEMESRSLLLARLLSQIFNPVFVTIAAYLLIGLQTLDEAGLAWVGGIIVFQTVPSVLYYLVRLRQGGFSDADVSVRHERNELYVFGTVSVLLTIVLLLALDAPRPFLALTVGMLGIGIICGLINLIWKISMHGAAIGALATLALIYSNILGVVFWICAGAVAWARVRTRNHTPGQVIAGLAVAAMVVTVSFLALA